MHSLIIIYGRRRGSAGRPDFEEVSASVGVRVEIAGTKATWSGSLCGDCRVQAHSRWFRWSEVATVDRSTVESTPSAFILLPLRCRHPTLNTWFIGIVYPQPPWATFGWGSFTSPRLPQGSLPSHFCVTQVSRDLALMLIHPSVVYVLF